MKPRSSCTIEIFNQALAAIRAGTTMRKFIDDNQELNPAFPCIDTLRAFISADSARIAALASAREIGADAMTDDTIHIADTVKDPQLANNRIKARQWLAAKMKPKVYGDKIDIDMKGTIDIATAITAARQRAQLIDITPNPALLTSDIQSDDETPIDPFS